MVNTASLLMFAVSAMTIGTFLYLNVASPATSTAPTVFGARRLASSPIISGFSAYSAKFGKTYENAAEVRYRRAVYEENIKKIDAHNRKGKSYTLGETRFTDMTPQEARAKFLAKPVKNNSLGSCPARKDRPKNSVDWRQKNIVTPVKNQENCGSCWAFSATGAIESAVALKKLSQVDATEGDDKLAEFSEQELVDCSRKQGNGGCDGGLPTNAFDYVKKFKIGTEEEYPYEAVDGRCRRKSTKTRTSITSYTTMPKPSVDSLLDLIDQKPVSVGFEVQDDFFNYTGGIYSNDDPDCGLELNHGVLAVGYVEVDDKTQSYYIVKNSWGEDWGEEGFFRMELGEVCGTCGIANEFDSIVEL